MDLCEFENGQGYILRSVSKTKGQEQTQTNKTHRNLSLVNRNLFFCLFETLSISFKGMRV